MMTSLKYNLANFCLDEAVIDESEFAYATDGKFVKPLRVALDLDDTLLNNSHTRIEDWKKEFEGTHYKVSCIETITYSKLKRSPRGWLNFLLGKKKRLQYDSNRYPFLAEPEIESQLRPGMIQALLQLKKKGCSFFLMTASARIRVQFLFKRFPLLKSLFENGNGVLQVACAEDIASCVLKIDQMETTELRQLSRLEENLFSASIQTHRLRPNSLAMKTPLVFEMLFNQEGYDLLVDDSETTSSFLNKTGLSELLLEIEPGYSHTGYGLEIVDALDSISQGNNNPMKLPYEAKYDGLLEGKTLTRIEDPYYWPYVNRSDKLSENSIFA